MENLKEVAKFLKDEVEFLKENEEYAGGWLQLSNGLAIVVCWEEGWGKEKRDDAIQSKSNPDYALVAGIKVYNPHDTPDYWTMLSDEEGNIVTETTGITPNENYEHLAKVLLQDFENVKDVDYDEDGVIHMEPKEESCKAPLKEDYGRAADVLADLVDRAKLWIKDGSDKQEAIERAIDDGLIYTQDIIDLGEYYGVIDERQLLSDMYDNLYSDMMDELEDVPEEDGFGDED